MMNKWVFVQRYVTNGFYSNWGKLNGRIWCANRIRLYSPPAKKIQLNDVTKSDTFLSLARAFS